ncbi:MAG: phosphoethanolamine transferase [Pseudomonadales bacterium]|nr:phosphoethanolamine transferase [Pseudomonadales bacterium]
MLKMKVLYLPALILVSMIFLNLDKYEYSFLKASVHVVFQSILVYGVLATSGSLVILRAFISLFITSALYIQLTYGAGLSVSVFMSMIESSSGESLAFIASNLFSTLFSITCLLLMTYLYVPTIKLITVGTLSVGLSYLIIPSVVTSHNLYSTPEYDLFRRSGIARGHSNLFTSVEYFIDDLSNRFPPLSSIRGITDTVSLVATKQNMESTWTEVTLKGSSNLLVLGIGESLRADNMEVYGYKKDTTPRLSSMVGSIDLYTRAYSAGTTTWSSIPSMLTKAGSIPDFSKSIINLARDAGYETFWLSNNTKHSEWDFSVSAIAEQADHIYFVSDHSSDNQYDSVLVSKLVETLEASSEMKKRLIVLNFFGSHFNFIDRYPQEYSKFEGGDLKLDRYDNTVLYTDYIQSEVIKAVEKHGGKYMFFSDHGLMHPESVTPLRHDVRSDPDIDSVKVPFFVYPKTKMSIGINSVISLFYFECIFSEWSGISAAELKNGYCEDALGKKEVVFIDTNLRRHEVLLQGE